MADRPTRVRAAGYDATASLVATMRDTAIDAKDDAETAQAAAESAQSGAASSASAASSSASSAASSASAAASSASAAEAARDLASEIALGDADAAMAGAILNEASDTHSALTASIVAKLSSVNVRDYGAMGDGVTDDTAAFNEAIAEAESRRVKVWVPKSTASYKMSSGISFDVDKTGLLGDGSELDFSALSSGAALTLEASNASLLQKRKVRPLAGVILHGPGRATSVIGLSVQEANHDLSIEGVTLADFTITNFGTGMLIGNHAYLITCINGEFTGNGLCYTDSGATSVDSGERMTFVGCMFNNSTAGVVVKIPSATFVACSFDYIYETFVHASDGWITMIGCHVEGGIAGETTSAPILKATGNQGTIIWRGGFMIFDQPEVAIRDNYFDVSTGTGNFNGGGITVDGIVAKLTAPNVGLVTGSRVSQFVARDWTSNANDLIPLKGKNVLADGSFENATLSDDWSVSSASGTVTDRATTTLISVATSTDTARSGSRSLKVTKTGGVGGDQKTRLLVPVRPRTRLDVELWAAALSGQTGSVSFLGQYVKAVSTNANAYGYSVTLRQTAGQASGTVDLSSLSSTFTRIINANLKQAAPDWATHFLLEMQYNLWNATGGASIYYDDVVVSGINLG